jgi:hypothetical protein
MGAEFYLKAEICLTKKLQIRNSASRENDSRGRNYRHHSSKKALFVNDATSAQKRNKNDYRREPDVLIPVTTPAQVLSGPHQRSCADPPDFCRPAAPLDY